MRTRCATLGSLSRFTAARRRARGITLVELMVVALIMGILASIGIAAYGSYIRRSRAAEARTMLAQIGTREEAYRSEFSKYCSAGRTAGSPPTALGLANAWPATSPTLGAADWNASTPTEWAQLGVRPQGFVYYRYVVVAGQPPATPPSEPSYTSSPNQDAWWVAEAYGDLNRNGIDSTFHLSSISNAVIVTPDETE